MQCRRDDFGQNTPDVYQYSTNNVALQTEIDYNAKGDSIVDVKATQTNHIQTVDMETQTMVSKRVNAECQTDNIVQNEAMRYIGTNVDTGEKEYEMIC